jgi:hypothetical protein
LARERVQKQVAEISKRKMKKTIRHLVSPTLQSSSMFFGWLDGLNFIYKKYVFANLV